MELNGMIPKLESHENIIINHIQRDGMHGKLWPIGD